MLAGSNAGRANSPSVVANGFTRITTVVQHYPWQRRGAPQPAEPEPSLRAWTFLTNHAHVLLCLARGEA